MKTFVFGALALTIFAAAFSAPVQTAQAAQGVRCKVIDVDAFPGNRRCTLKCEDGRVREIQPCTFNIGDPVTVRGGKTAMDADATVPALESIAIK